MKKIIYMLSFVVVFSVISYTVALVGATYGDTGSQYGVEEKRCPTIEILVDKNTSIPQNADSQKIFEPFIDDGVIEYGDITNETDLPKCEPIEIFLN